MRWKACIGPATVCERLVLVLSTDPIFLLKPRILFFLFPFHFLSFHDLSQTDDFAPTFRLILLLAWTFCLMRRRRGEAFQGTDGLFHSLQKKLKSQVRQNLHHEIWKIFYPWLDCYVAVQVRICLSHFSKMLLKHVYSSTRLTVMCMISSSRPVSWREIGSIFWEMLCEMGYAESCPSRAAQEHWTWCFVLLQTGHGEIRTQTWLMLKKLQLMTSLNLVFFPNQSLGSDCNALSLLSIPIEPTIEALDSSHSGFNQRRVFFGKCNRLVQVIACITKWHQCLGNLVLVNLTLHYAKNELILFFFHSFITTISRHNKTIHPIRRFVI